MSFRRFVFPFLAALLLTPALLHAESGMAIAPETCLKCHEGVVSPVEYGASVHGQNACTSCHVEVADLAKHIAGDVMPGEPKCVRCHKVEAADHFASVHQLN
jgi:predicted CXXCH cytochrome family protein